MSSKKYFMVALVLIGFIFANSAAQFYSEKEKLVGVIQRLVLLTAALYGNDYHVAHVEVDRVEKGETYSYTRKLYGGNIYKILGIGGEGISDLDIRLYHNGDLIKEDNSTDNLPEVTYYVKKTGIYRIDIIAYSLEDGADEDAEYFFVSVIGYQ